MSFKKIATAFESRSKYLSSLRRIQRFIAEYTLNPYIVAKLIFPLFPKQEKYALAIDRTNWKFGKTDINIFMLGVVYQGVAFPLLFSMLPKRGNSSSKERIDLIERFVALFGKDVISSLTADREFVGAAWISYLNKNKIKYYIRIRNNFKVSLPHKNKEVKAFWLFNALKVNEFVHYPKIVRIKGQLCYLSGCRTKDEYLIIISFNEPKEASQLYKERWQIETLFKSMKSSGFDFEKTHLTDIERIERLLLLVMIALLWCYKVGILLNQIKPIEIKKHGRKAKSIF